jgi:sarcosine oxidase
MSSFYDVAIIGAGAMGSAAAYHLSKTEKGMLVLDQFSPPHDLGSSHGETRIIREAYFESPMYVPLVQKAYELWHQLEEESGEQLFLKTGGLMLGDKDSKVFSGAELSAERYHIWYEELDGKAISERFPAFKAAPETVAVYEKNAGLLYPEACVRAHLTLAQKTNADLHFNEQVNTITTRNGLIEIGTDKEIYLAEKIIVSAGAWLTKLFPELHLPLQVARQVLMWFDFASSHRESFSPGKMPVYIWEYAPKRIFYGFPALGNKLKVAIHHEGVITDPDTIDRAVHDDEIKQLFDIISQFLDVEVRFSHAAVCMYTNTPSEDFIIDHHPQNKNIIIASPCSGHGFKFSSAIGKLLCDIVCERNLDFDISLFSIGKQLTVDR